MSETSRDLLLEIGCEELPSSFVKEAIDALPALAKKRLGAARLVWSGIGAYGTPRRLALSIQALATGVEGVSEEVTGPPVRAAFKDGKPTRAAEAFAEKLGVAVDALRRVETPKGEYLVGLRHEAGGRTIDLLPAILEGVIREIPFRKSMRWADFDFAFGRPIQWLVALFGDDVIPLEIASKKSGRTSTGHRFLSAGALTVSSPGEYVGEMRSGHVLVDPAERRAALASALARATESAGGELIEDEFLMGENVSLVEEPFVLVGSFDPSFLELPERVILAVAKGHQRYFGLRKPAAGGKPGALMPNYLAVVNTALDPALIVKGNDRVMRARLADAQFFYREDLKVPLAARREKLRGVVFQKKLGTVLEKSDRVEVLVRELGRFAGVDSEAVKVAEQGAQLAKCDLVSYMVGEFPELQGEMGAAYAIAQGQPREVAEVIKEHYRPKGAHDDTPTAIPAALVSIADRLDTLTGCFAIGLAPTGTSDAFGLRRAVLGVLRTMLDRDLDLDLAEMVGAAYDVYASTERRLETSKEELTAKLLDFAAERLRVLFSDKSAPQSWPADAVRACIAAGYRRPLDLRRRVTALAELDGATRAQVGEVFKRAANIATQAEPGEPAPPAADAHKSEAALFEAYGRFSARHRELSARSDYAAILREVALIAPVMHQYFVDVMVMCDDLEVRKNRLRLMRSIADRCARVAHLEHLAGA